MVSDEAQDNCFFTICNCPLRPLVVEGRGKLSAIIGVINYMSVKYSLDHDWHDDYVRHPIHPMPVPLGT
jgi:hypothetical protein